MIGSILFLREKLPISMILQNRRKQPHPQRIKDLVFDWPLNQKGLLRLAGQDGFDWMQDLMMLREKFRAVSSLNKVVKKNHIVTTEMVPRAAAYSFEVDPEWKDKETILKKSQQELDTTLANYLYRPIEHQAIIWPAMSDYCTRELTTFKINLMNIDKKRKRVYEGELDGVEEQLRKKSFQKGKQLFYFWFRAMCCSTTVLEFVLAVFARWRITGHVPLVLKKRKRKTEKPTFAFIPIPFKETFFMK